MIDIGFGGLSIRLSFFVGNLCHFAFSLQFIQNRKNQILAQRTMILLMNRRCLCNDRFPKCICIFHVVIFFEECPNFSKIGKFRFHLLIDCHTIQPPNIFASATDKLLIAYSGFVAPALLSFENFPAFLQEYHSFAPRFQYSQSSLGIDHKML